MKVLKNVFYIFAVYLICLSTNYFTCVSCDNLENREPPQQKEKISSRILPLNQLSPRFSLSDPSISTPRGSGQKIVPSHEHGDKIFILVIEDQRLVWTIFENVFQRTRKKDFMKFKLLFSETGEEGVRLHALHRPCLTFIDHHLAGKMNGKDGVNIKYSVGCLVAFSSEPQMNANMGTDFQIPKMEDIKLFQDIIIRVLGGVV